MKCPSFVWTPGLKGPRPSIWHVPQTQNMKPITPLQFHDLTADEEAMTLDQLAVKYPFKNPNAPTPPDQPAAPQAALPVPKDDVA